MRTPPPLPKNIRKQKKYFSTRQKWSILAGLFLLSITALPAILVLLIGLLPTITIFITDQKNTNKLMVVGCFNLAGVFIYLINIISNFSINGAFYILSDIFNLVIMLGSAAIGLIVYVELPNLFVFISKSSAKKRVDRINTLLEKYSQEWGPQILEDKK